MKNKIADEALNALHIEANRVSDNSLRENALKKLSVLRKAFEDMDNAKTDNPPGKSVIRDESGSVIGSQG